MELVLEPVSEVVEFERVLSNLARLGFLVAWECLPDGSYLIEVKDELLEELSGFPQFVRKQRL
ncbi:MULTISPECIES: hypothetical protein [unclassified Cupriavidus]|uniref:hypothetical protein n=1 Tax=unclassified Cupriavidus TaxID=2640874 RepID=UPI0010F927AA|nr:MULTISPECIES: hypothetical protein [unclassified Cupriavidus]MWL92124.1 hypothetical protein [Cupriavidus sp. SW-Y-13]